MKATEVVSNSGEAKGYDYYNKKICKLAPTSKLCNNKPLYEVLESISKKNNAPLRIMLGIMWKESKFGTAYHKSNREDCRENTNNRHWSKANHNWQKASRTTEVWPWCWLQKYDTIEEGFASLSYTIGVWYKRCVEWSRPAYCMSQLYVWDPKKYEYSRYSFVESWR